MKRKKLLFYQDWGTFYPCTLIVCGFESTQEILSIIKKRKDFDWYEAVKAKGDLTDHNHFSRWEFKNKIYSLLWMKTWKADIHHYKILSHEIVHAIMFMMPDFLDPFVEYEAIAYQHSYLFENLANKFNKYLR